MRAAAAAASVGALAVATFLGFGVGLEDIVRFVGFEFAFVLAPGIAVLRSLLPWARGPLAIVGFGWALGHALELLASAATAAVGARSLIWLYPPLVVAFAVGFRTNRPQSPLRLGSGPWPVAGAAAALVGYLAVAAFAPTPFPWDVRAVWFLPDLPFHLSLAAEAAHHWPLEDPSASGEPLPYHVWANLHVATASRLAGVDLPLVALRLAPLGLALSLVLALAAAGRLLVGKALAGVLVVALVLFVGEVDVSLDEPTTFLGLVARGLWLSPSYLLGLVFFVPTVAVLALLTSSEVRGPGVWVVLSLLAVGCAGAKATITPVLVGGLIGLVAWTLIRERRLDTLALGAGAVVVGAWAAFYAATYRSGSSYGLDLQLLGAFRAMPALADLRDFAGTPAVWLVAPVLGVAGLYGPALVGLPFVRWTDERGARRRAFLVAVLGAGLVPLFITHHGGSSELYFANYGFVAGCLLSAEGLLELGGRSWRLLAPVAAVLMLGALDLPLDHARPVANRLLHGDPLYAASTAGLTNDLYRGLAWLRDETPEDAVIAVSNQYEYDVTSRYPSYYWYSAFGERRVFLEGWAFSARSNALGFGEVLAGNAVPYPERLRLNEAVFERGDARALGILVRDHGVRYLLVDEVHGGGAPAAQRFGSVVFANRDVTVRAVGP